MLYAATNIPICCWQSKKLPIYELIAVLCLILPLLILSYITNARAKPIIADMSDYQIAIDSRFTGKRILLFGARNDPGDILVVVRGPKRNITIRKKEQIAGIWLNAAQVKFAHIPYYYAISATRPISSMTMSELYKSLAIGIDNIEFNTPRNITYKMAQEFAAAYMQIQQQKGLYLNYEYPVTFMGETLFKTAIQFPDNLPRGDYAVEIYLIEDGILRGVQTLPIHVTKVGFDAFVYSAAHDHPLLYGIMAIMIAVTVGWVVSFIFNRIW